MLEPNRLFFALWPDDAVRLAAHSAAKALKVKMQPGGHLAALERYHITLLFLGDFVSEDNQAAAMDAAAGLRAAPFTLTLDQAGSFKSAKIPWWLGPRQVPDALTRLYRGLYDQMVEAHVVPERMKFAPHLTVLRDAGLALPKTGIEPIQWEIKDFVLVRSRLDLKPVRYDLLGRWPLVEADAPPPKAQMSLF